MTTYRRIDFERVRCACGHYGQPYDGGLCLACVVAPNAMADLAVSWLNKQATGGVRSVAIPSNFGHRVRASGRVSR